MVIRVNEGRGGNRLVVAAANYVVAALLSYVMVRVDGGVINGDWALVGGALGIGFVAGFLTMMKGIREIGVAIPTSAARLSMLIPVIGSIIVFNERPTLLKIVGICTGLVAFGLLGLSQRKSSKVIERSVGVGGIAILLLLFSIVGMTDFGMKISITHGADNNVLTFLIFSSAAILCGILVLTRRQPITPGDLLLGSILGIPNFCSVLFLLLALRRLEASSVFPAVSTGAVVLITLIGAVVWRERPNRLAGIGLALAAIAVALLA